MILEITTRLDYAVDPGTDILLQIEAAALDSQKVLSADLSLCETKHLGRIPGEDMIGERIWLRLDDALACTYTARLSIERPAVDLPSLSQVPMHLLPGDAVKYLMGSRYCPSDMFQSFVDAEFGDYAGGARVAALSDWIMDRFEYVPGSSDQTTTALDTIVQRRGICRDFAHVLITLCRASAIPARIVSAYGVGVEPPDFHAVAEVFLDGEWHLVDPTGMSAADRMAIIGVGRDAADVAFLTSYGLMTLNTQTVDVRIAD